MALHYLDRRGLFNSTCPLPKSYIDLPNHEKPIVGHITFQSLMVYIAAGSTILTIVFNMALVGSHLLNYTRPTQQRQIIRIIFYPVIFGLLSTASIYSYPLSIYLEPVESIYEPVALVAIFFLFLDYVAPDTATREAFFSELENRTRKGGKFTAIKNRITHKGGPSYEIVPGGSFRWYQSKWVAIYFYFFATIVIHTIEEITQSIGRYCASSWSPTYAHVWVFVISKLVLPVGVAAVLMFYFRMKDESAFQNHGAKQKLISFKALIAIDVLQALLFSILTGKGVLGTPYNKAQDEGLKTVTYKDLSIGLPHMLVTIEQLVVAIWFHWSFSAREYRDLKKATHEHMPMWRAIFDALNPMDLLTGLVYAFKLLLSGVGPKGNGSWTKSGGYKELKEPGQVKYEGQEPLRTTYLPPDGSPPYPGVMMQPYNPRTTPFSENTAYDHTYDHTHEDRHLGHTDEETGGLLPPMSSAEIARHTYGNAGDYATRYSGA